jgi:hypothetical protein
MAWYDGLSDWASNNGAGISAGIGLLAGSQDGQDQVTIRKPYMLPGQQQMMTNFMNTAKDRYMAGPQQYYGGNSTANLDPNVIKGQNMALGAASQQKGMVNSMMEGGAKLMSGGDTVSGFNLPSQVGFGINQGLQDATLNPIFRNLEERVMPGMDLAATSQGAFGGTRHAQMKGQAVADATSQATDALAQANLAARGQSIGQRAGDISAQIQSRGQDITQIDNQMGNVRAGMHYMPGAINATLAPANTAMGIGADRMAYEQQQINGDMNRWNFEQQAPWNAIDWLGQSVNMQFPGSRTTNVQGQDATWMDGLGGAATGLGIYNSIFKDTA